MAAEPLGVWGADREMEARLRAVPPSTHPAFDELYREHYDRLRRFVLGMTGRETVAEDIAQETLLRAYIRMEKLDFDRPLWPWLKQVATRLVYDHTRSDREICLDDPAPEAAATDDVADRLAERDLVARVLRRLPPRQRAAVTLRYLEDWKAGELADLFSLPRPAVEQLLLRARRSLGAEYRRLGGDRLRIALWPVFVVLARLRERASRFAANAGQAGANSAASAFDAATQAMVAVVVSTGLVASGVAFAEAVPSRVAAAKSAVEQSTDARAVARSAAGARSVAVGSAANTSRTAEAQSPRQRKAVAVPEAPAPETRSRGIDLHTPTNDVVETPKGDVKTGPRRDAPNDRVLFSRDVGLSTGGASVHVTGESRLVCGDGDIQAASCDAYDAADATAPDLP